MFIASVVAIVSLILSVLSLFVARTTAAAAAFPEPVFPGLRHGHLFDGPQFLLPDVYRLHFVRTHYLPEIETVSVIVDFQGLAEGAMEEERENTAPGLRKTTIVKCDINWRDQGPPPETYVCL